MTEKIIVVSGGSRGLGLEVVRSCLKRGWAVATFSRSRTTSIKELQNDAEISTRFFWSAVDAHNSAELKNFTKCTFSRFGRIDGLVNNMGIGSDGLLALMRADDIDDCLNVNLRSTIYLTQACIRSMLQQQRGAIVNISSVNAIRGHAGVAVYGATKAGMEGLGRCLARELGEKSIRVNTVAPGYFESDMVSELSVEQKNRIARRTPLGRLAKIEEVVEVIMFLLSDKSSFVTGQLLAVDGGITC